MGDFGPGLVPEATQLPRGPTDSSATTEDINVLVTGFGPFQNQPINPSFLIASSLPTTVTLPASTSTPHRIRIHTHPVPIRVSYSAVRTAVPSIIEAFSRAHDGQKPDIIIHIGMASMRQYYAVETRARRDGYTLADVDGQVGFDDGERCWKQAGLPEVLQPGQEVSAGIAPSATAETTITPPATTTFSAPFKGRTCPRPLDTLFLHTWRAHIPGSTDIRLSDDAGRYVCEFIYFSSLANAFQARHDRSVVFLHVPGWTDEASLERGRDVVIALVKTLVGCWIEDNASKRAP